MGRQVGAFTVHSDKNDGHPTGFVAIVDKDMSSKYEKLVNDAPELIKVLPWGPNFEVDVFRKPDFTALRIVSFATGGIPAGINVRSPNFSHESSCRPAWIDSQLLRDPRICGIQERLTCCQCLFFFS